MIRNDFVSNSSSSSFIIGFKTKKMFEDFKKDMLDEWGRDNKFGKLLIKFLEDGVIPEEDRRECYTNKKYSEYEVLLRGIWQSTEDDFDTLAPGLLVYESVPDDDDVTILSYD